MKGRKGGGEKQVENQNGCVGKEVENICGRRHRIKKGKEGDEEKE